MPLRHEKDWARKRRIREAAARRAGKTKTQKYRRKQAVRQSSRRRGGR